MSEQMGTDIPRFNPVPYGGGIDSPASMERTPELDASPVGRKSHRRTRLFSQPASPSYRWRVVLLSTIACLGGTAFTIYNSTVGR